MATPKSPMHISSSPDEMENDDTEYDPSEANKNLEAFGGYSQGSSDSVDEDFSITRKRKTRHNSKSKTSATKSITRLVNLYLFYFNKDSIFL